VTAAEVRVLGPVEVVGDEGVVALPAKQRRLLAALVAAGRACSVDELVEVVWGEAPPASARKLVQVYVSALRKALPSGIRIETETGAYALALAPDQLDAVRFEQLAAESASVRATNPALAVSLCDRALALWRSPAYGDLAYEDRWRGEAERLDELRLSALEERLTARLELEGRGHVLGEALALAQDHPLRERFQELAILALYRAGRQAESLEHYEATRRRLRDELGLAPGPALRGLQVRILQQDPSLGPAAAEHAPARPLPIPPSPLVGRREELRRLERLLVHRQARLLVLTGAGGSGKTRLALEAARRARRGFANGAVLVELAPLRDPELVPATIAQALDVASGRGATPEEALEAGLADHELLLLLDNVEHLREATPLFSRLLARAPRLTILATSRAVLHLSGEHVFPVAPLDEDDALELFVQRAQSLEPSFVFTESIEADLREICRRLDGLPLAIELAAARIRMLTPEGLRDRLGERLALLTNGPRDLPARQRTLRETIDWSVQLLREDERRAFARLAVFPGGATIDAADAVCDCGIDTLGVLADGNLMKRLDTAGEPRFHMLETVREYALELLGDDRQTTELELAEHLATLVERAVLKGAGAEVWLPRLDAELDNLRTALGAAAAAGNPELELRIAGGLWRYWWIRGFLAEGRERLTAALDRADGLETAAHARALAGAAGLAYSSGDLHTARDLATKAIRCAETAGALYDESSARVVLGVVANATRDWDEARRHLQRSIEIAHKLGIEPDTEKMNLGVTALESGEYDAAIELFEELAVRHDRNGSDEGVGFALLNCGLARYRIGDDGRAATDFEEAGRRFDRIGFRAHAAHALLGRAATDARTGRFEDASILLGRSAGMLDELGWTGADFDPRLKGEIEAAATSALGREVFEAAFAAGHAAGRQPNA
jgi:predicted ATPase/DNA-binding SARP family transcriptional activator